ncbi:SCO2584 family spore wall biosynthesis protein [Streptomyces litchfieldiae]|uniref:Uncharacterized protein n=1 Tax=Streptomyces litchfieldiae TaxID=3075543 RepID=A0ABU2MN16_9ACTN|nr:hypothetical protein [Streptomyces sp. DSM 44938]MDT0342733.1 hypothetical protein [Streptomyces sp. DSM 44938]
MPEDVGGLPFRDGDGPDSEDRGAADEAFASVVLDDDFVEAAEVHEPTAAERILYAAMERAEAEAAAELGFYRDPDLDPGASDGLAGFDDEEDADDEGRFDRSDYTRYFPDDDEADDIPPGLGPYGSRPMYGYEDGVGTGAIRGPGAREAQPPPWRPVRWQRPVACVLAMVMGISVIAFALIAIQRAGSAQSREPERDDEEQTIVDADFSEGGS